MAMPLIAQKYDPVDGGFETRERKIQTQTNPRLQQKNLEEWMAFNLGYAPAGGLVQHNGGYAYTWLQGASVVWKGPNPTEILWQFGCPKGMGIVNHRNIAQNCNAMYVGICYCIDNSLASNHFCLSQTTLRVKRCLKLENPIPDLNSPPIVELMSYLHRRLILPT